MFDGWQRLRGEFPCVVHAGLDTDTCIRRSLADLNRKVDQMTDQQAELDTDVQALGGVLGTIQTAEQANTKAVQDVAAEIADLKNANPAVDFSGLETLINGSPDGTTPGLVQAAADVQAGVAAVQGLVPAPAPAPDQPPA